MAKILKRGIPTPPSEKELYPLIKQLEDSVDLKIELEKELDEATPLFTPKGTIGGEKWKKVKKKIGPDFIWNIKELRDNIKDFIIKPMREIILLIKKTIDWVRESLISFSGDIEDAFGLFEGEINGKFTTFQTQMNNSLQTTQSNMESNLRNTQNSMRDSVNQSMGAIESATSAQIRNIQSELINQRELLTQIVSALEQMRRPSENTGDTDPTNTGNNQNDSQVDSTQIE